MCICIYVMYTSVCTNILIDNKLKHSTVTNVDNNMLNNGNDNMFV